MKDVGAEQSRGLPWNFCSLAPFPLALNCFYCATTVHLLSRATFLSIGGRPVARNNRTRTTKVDDSNDLSRRRFIQSVAAAAGILGLNPSSQAEAAQKTSENNGKDDFKGKPPKPGSSGTSFISLFNNLGTNYSSTPGPISFQNENGAAGILSLSDINLSNDNATISISTSGIYSIQYNATIELETPSTGEWFTAINVNRY
jgi:hypothetical protein